jgi:hypothetical protein
VYTVPPSPSMDNTDNCTIVRDLALNCAVLAGTVYYLVTSANSTLNINTSLHVTNHGTITAHEGESCSN